MYRFAAPVMTANATASLADCTRAIDGGEIEIALDALERSNSSAVAVLLAAVRHAGATGKVLRFSGMPAAIGSLAALYGVDALLIAPHAAAPLTPAWFGRPGVLAASA